MTLATAAYGWGALAVDPTAVYGITSGRVVKVPLPCGGTPTTLGGQSAGAIAIDAANVYWTDSSGSRGFTVQATAKTGGVPKVIATLPYALPWTGGGSALAVDSSAVYVLGTEDGDGPCAGGIVHCLPGVVVRVPLDGAAPTTVASEQANPMAIAVDATNIYWVTNGPDVYYPGDSKAQGTVVEAPLAGGASTTLAASQAQPNKLFLQASTLYWFDDYGSSILSMPTAGGTPITVLDNDLLIQGITVDAEGLYLVEAGSVETVPPGGGMPTSVAMAALNYDGEAAIAVDATSVFWSNGNDLLRAPK